MNAWFDTLTMLNIQTKWIIQTLDDWPLPKGIIKVQQHVLDNLLLGPNAGVRNAETAHPLMHRDVLASGNGCLEDGTFRDAHSTCFSGCR